MKIAVEGCAHGELEKIYETIKELEKRDNIKVDMLICCGDFQSTRNMEDLQTMAVSQKYQDICTFYKYYSGELRAPMLTIFIGGNHEASNYLQELPYGGWVAPNIYYLGYAGVVRVNGLRIAGISGIYKGHDFLRGRFEFSPYTDSTKRSVYHVRQLEVFRLKQLSGKVDICLSHDWPKGIYNFGNKQQLARFKPFLREEMDNDKLGSRPCEDLLNLLKPQYWFAAHLHCKFAAVVPHENDMKDDGNEEDNANVKPSFTKFLALDKCLPKRRFLQILDINSENYTDDEGDLRFEYDLEWLTILYLTNHLINVKEAYYYLPNKKSTNGERFNFTPTEEEMQHVRQKFENDMKIPHNFCRTVEAFDPSTYSKGQHYKQPKSQINPQSLQFCDTLGIDDPLALAMLMGGHELSHSSTLDNTQDSALSDSILQDDQQSTSLNTSNTSGACLTASSPLKRKSNSGLILPKPKSDEGNVSVNTEEITLDEETDTVETNTDVVEAVALEETPALTLNETSAKPPIKKFKRRNQEIYQENEDTEELKAAA
ncbi:lariat debranching enzyme [Lucilia cuprina]|uniref:lariat debranching enzyme n=1 Tax=Lucilia cuprina TaxID=7375 RepID=UPI001F06D80D|nr:lariat debranching enzyme [Lucilia cuprina]XP_046807425.1 lariat debranching enzyme [Lucilia cuprina]